MATDMDHFGSLSNGLDRAQLHAGPPSGPGPPGDKSTDPRPPPEALDYQKPSIRQAFKDNFISVLFHPRYGTNKIKAVVNEKRAAENGQPHKHHHDNAPTLAPPPKVGTVNEQRLEHELEDKPQIPPLKEFMRQPIAAIRTTIQGRFNPSSCRAH